MKKEVKKICCWFWTVFFVFCMQAVFCKKENPKPYKSSDVSGKWMMQLENKKMYLTFSDGSYILEIASDLYAPGRLYREESGSYYIVVDSLHFNGSRYLYDVKRNLVDSLAITYSRKYLIRNDTMFVCPQIHGCEWLIKL